MSKKEFLEKLRVKLSNLPKDDLEERINFYSEMIDDRIEDGFSEEDAINDIGSLDEVAKQIIANVPLKKLIKEKVKPKRKMSTTAIVLIILGSPIWLSLLVAVFAIVIAIYAVIFSLVVSLWAIDFSLVLCGIAGTIAGIIYLAQGASALILGGSIVCIGLGILLFFGCKEFTKFSIFLSKEIVKGIKNMFINKEGR